MEALNWTTSKQSEGDHHQPTYSKYVNCSRCKALFTWLWVSNPSAMATNQAHSRTIKVHFKSGNLQWKKNVTVYWGVWHLGSYRHGARNTLVPRVFSVCMLGFGGPKKSSFWRNWNTMNWLFEASSLYNKRHFFQFSLCFWLSVNNLASFKVPKWSLKTLLRPFHVQTAVTNMTKQRML